MTLKTPGSTNDPTVGGSAVRHAATGAFALFLSALVSQYLGLGPTESGALGTAAAGAVGAGIRWLLGRL
jgi:hypothetical protein